MVSSSTGRLAEFEPASATAAFPDAGRRLRLGLACSLNAGEGRRLVARFRASNLGRPVAFGDGDEIELSDGLDHGRYDVIIVPQGAVRRGWRSIPLWTEPLVAVLREGHLLAADGALQPASLKGEPLLLAGDGVGDRAFRRVLFEAIGGIPAQVVHHQVQRDTLLDLVALGLGVTVTPEGALGACYPGVSVRPLLGSQAHITYSLMWRADAGDAAARDLLQGLSECSGDRAP